MPCHNKKGKRNRKICRELYAMHKWEKDGKVMGIHMSVIKMDGSINGK